MIKLNFRSAITAAALLCGGAGAAVAQSPMEVYFGVHGGKTFSNTAIDSVSPNPSQNIIDGLGATGWLGGVHGGVDVKVANSPFFAGVFGGYTWQNTEFSVGGGAFTANLRDSWDLGARAGMYVGKGKVYVLGAYRNTELAFSSSANTIDLTGYDVGAGVSFPLAQNIDLGLEGRWTQYQAENLATGIDMTTDQLGVMARLTFVLGRSGEQTSLFSEELNKPCDPKLANCKR